MGSDAPRLFDLPSATSGRFEPARLTQARVRLGLSKTELAGEVGVSANAIGQYEAGVNSPRPEVLSRLADALKVRPGFFSVGRPMARLEAVNAHFRSLRSARVGERQKALAMATLIWEITFALERFVRLPEVDLPVVPAGSSPSEAAAALRRHWNLPDGPVKHLAATVESHGVVIAARPLAEIDAVDAFSAMIVDRPIILMTPRRSANVFRHRFSIAHELGHLLLHGDSGEHGVAIEREADEFAAAFLTPAAAMDGALPQRLDLAALDRLGRTWGVSPTSLVRRMVERGRTTESSARRAYQRLAMTDDPKADPTSAYPGEMQSLISKANQLSEDVGGGAPAVADALRLFVPEVRDLLGVVDQRPVLRLIQGAG
ncbi:XRE family transcriptional regulator [Isoptericola sp. NPDC056618]|uniref:XRE family transcriptional regulator n=1 Tax=Isoptericola sp. NPDC056618 TaxID=3345878 RepID=UPI00368934E2